ncbi:carbohydrate-binding protein [Kribbella antibiotica]|uniref:Carbohydrate-binding protein n=1 Tax=Kribbella antibiotica TaxID=190195 RepID=A0A4R4Z6Q2_9ACTN|nr:CBM35 domain-containing protein [Kribbella antibiotica]TDD53858.1 carbohydrate-binding protein [Kribbella antibiotica]
MKLPSRITATSAALVVALSGLTIAQAQAQAEVNGPLTTSTYEAERAGLENGAQVNNNHRGYTGTGFVDNYVQIGTKTKFTVTVPTAGAYKSTLRYSAGPHASATRSLSIYINGVRERSTSLPQTASWDTWTTKTDVLQLVAGTNTIAYRYDVFDVGWINLDNLTIAKA